MMKKIICISIVLSSVYVFCGEFETYDLPEVPCTLDKNTVLLADFEKNAGAQSAIRKINVTVKGESVLSDGKFGKGFVSQKNVQDVACYDSVNLTAQSRGTLEFWFKYQKPLLGGPITNKFPHFLGTANSDGSSCIFVLYRDDAYDIRRIQILFSRPGEKPTTFDIEAKNLDIESWNHIGFVWDGNSAAVFANGRFVSPPLEDSQLSYAVSTYLGDTMALGASIKTTTVAGMVFDDVRISDIIRYGNKKETETRGKIENISGSISVGAESAGGQSKPPEGDRSDFSLPAKELQNPSFESGMQGWVLKRFFGGTGSCRLVTNFAHEGKNSIYFQKENGDGYLSLRSEYPITLTPGEKYTFRAWYKADNVKYPMTSLLLRVEQRADSLNYESILDQGRGLTTQTAMINTPTGTWYKRLYNLKIDQGCTKAYIHFIVLGNPAGVWIDNLTIEKYEESEKKWVAAMGPYAPRPLPDGLLSKEDLQTVLKKSPACTARLEKKDGSVTLLVNGIPAAPILHKPDGGNWAEHHLGRYFQEQNVKIHLAVQNFDFIKGSSTFNYPLWIGPKQYDFARGVDAIEQVMRGVPDGYLMLELCIGSYRTFIDSHPDECWQDKSGLRGYRTGVHFAGFTDKLPGDKFAWAYSYYSETWRAEVQETLQAYMDYLKKTPYYKRIIGFMITGGHDGQFSIPNQDYGKPAVIAFRRWLQKKYQTDAALARAWNSPGLTINEASMPDLTSKNDQNKLMYDPTVEMNRIDYRQFHYETTWETTEFIARTIKVHAGKDVICFRYFFGGLANMPTSTKSVSDKFFQSMYMDGVAPQPMYPYRQNGFTLTMRQIMESYLLHNKMVIMEFDQRTKPRSAEYPELNYLEYSVATSVPEWKEIHRKCLGEILARGQGLWYYDMPTGWFHEPLIYKDIGAAMRDAEYLRDGKKNFRADVAVIVDEKTDYRCPYNEGVGHPPLDLCQREIKTSLNLSGVPYDYYYFSDLKNNPSLQNYKIYIFATTWYLTKTDRVFIDTLKNKQRVLIWLYAPGYYDENGAAAQNMSAVTGITIEPGEVMQTEPVLSAETKHTLRNGLLPLQGLAYLQRQNWRMENTVMFLDNRRFAADDARAVVLARYKNDGKAAIVVRDFPDWRSVYIAQPGGLNPELLNNVAREAGAYTLCDPWISTEMNDNFICVHGTRSGAYTFKLKKKRTVKNVRDEKIIATGVERFDYSVEAGKTYWFGLF